jgi:hypothetical protein
MQAKVSDETLARKVELSHRSTKINHLKKNRLYRYAQPHRSTIAWISDPRSSSPCSAMTLTTTRPSAMHAAPYALGKTDRQHQGSHCIVWLCSGSGLVLPSGHGLSVRGAHVGSPAPIGEMPASISASRLSIIFTTLGFAALTSSCSYLPRATIAPTSPE